MIALVAVLGGLLLLSHIVPFRFVQDWWHPRQAVWSVSDPSSVYLTFDDGPNPAATPELLGALKESNVQATFFLIDEYVNEDTAHLVKRMFDEGHCVAQHTGKRWLLVRSPGHVERMLRGAADKVERLTGRRPAPLFRPHAGWRSELLFRGASRAGYKIVGWGWRTFDWVGFRQRTAERVSEQVIRHAAPGKIIVIHDGHHKNPRADRAYAIEATRRIIPALRAKGLQFRTLCEAISPQPSARFAAPASRP